MDPHLNSLFDNSINPSEFVSKILALPHEQIMKIYMKLTSLKHSISKNMHKEIEAKYGII
jgi:CRISPR/Cas system CSM-associated protein Csm2 small subunit